jgi:hypothetical protein
MADVPTATDRCEIVWTPASIPPPRPETPYQPYLVWAKAPTGPIRSGVCRVVRWVRDAAGWEQVALERPGWGDALEVTHWAPCPRPEAAVKDWQR